ncbi:unnamed protein product [Eruca vesicaria subsp. sativa]|uniref:Uncharacterized protein n=1 Tax=Eruca vesicaria subsp. sativa TaxID=29727 RepID=A0ABC8L0S0_ERUVS|nr:unnamed protein product [Eruca vesicaria subsp. sativa]
MESPKLARRRIGDKHPFSTGDSSIERSIGEPRSHPSQHIIHSEIPSVTTEASFFSCQRYCHRRASSPQLKKPPLPGIDSWTYKPPFPRRNPLHNRVFTPDTEPPRAVDTGPELRQGDT